MSATVDRQGLLVGALAFSLALGIATVAVPLVALDAGYDAPSVGFLAAAAAAMQLAARVTLPHTLGRIPDRALIAGAAAMMAGAFAILVLSTALPAFVVAQLLQGAARAVFWTSSQTHAVRHEERPVRRLVDLTLSGNAGTLSGPVVAGVLGAQDLRWALLAGAAAGLVATATTALVLTTYPPFARVGGRGTAAMLRRKGVATAVWAAVVTGGWWSMLGSFVPVLLVGAGLGAGAIGACLTASEAAGAGALLVLRGVGARHLRPIVVATALLTCVALVGLGVGGRIEVLVALLLLGGATSGAVTALGPAMASLAATPDEQGDALALSGTFRAAALFASPAAVGALLGVLALPAAFVALGVALAVPAALIGGGPVSRSRGTPTRRHG